MTAKTPKRTAAALNNAQNTTKSFLGVVSLAHGTAPRNPIICARTRYSRINAASHAKGIGMRAAAALFALLPSIHAARFFVRSASQVDRSESWFNSLPSAQTL